jgi:hypothetical protein
MDPGRPKFQISWNWTKLSPLHRARRIDFSHILFSENGHHMRKLLRSEIFSKQGKSPRSKSIGLRSYN